MPTNQNRVSCARVSAASSSRVTKRTTIGVYLNILNAELHVNLMLVLPPLRPRYQGSVAVSKLTPFCRVIINQELKLQLDYHFRFYDASDARWK